MSETITRTEYRDEIETMADRIEDFLDRTPDAEVTELVFEDVDSSSLIMHYSHNLDVLRHAENDPQDWESLVPQGADYKKAIQIMAFTAMEQDLYDELRERELY